MSNQSVLVPQTYGRLTESCIWGANVMVNHFKKDVTVLLFPPSPENIPWLPQSPMNGKQPPTVLKSRDTTQKMEDMLSKCFKTQLKMPIRILYIFQFAHITRMVLLSITLKSHFGSENSTFKFSAALA